MRAWTVAEHSRATEIVRAPAPRRQPRRHHPQPALCRRRRIGGDGQMGLRPRYTRSPPNSRAPARVGTEHVLVGIFNASGPGAAALSSWSVTRQQARGRQRTGGIRTGRGAHPEHR